MAERRGKISKLTWEHLGILQEEVDIGLELPAGAASPRDLNPDKRLKMDGLNFFPLGSRRINATAATNKPICS